VQWNGTPVHQMKALGFEVELPRTDKLFLHCLLLPMNSMLTDSQVERIVNTVHTFYGSSS
jgi:dTDP-4-amino-4,6-dideoxygalactose transaminase